MKKAILIILGLFILVVGVLAIVIATRPDDYTISRSASFAGPPERVFEQVNDFRKWKAWSPWAKLDPEMKETYSGQESGTGSTYTWAGNNEVGEGRMTIIDSRPYEAVKIDLEFLKPFSSKTLTEFSMKPDSGKTNVTWTMSGKHDMVSKAFGLFIDMDNMVGTDFEKGLAQMKTIVESGQ